MGNPAENPHLNHELSNVPHANQTSDDSQVFLKRPETAGFDLDSLPQEAIDALLDQAAKREIKKEISRLIKEEMINFVNQRKTGGDVTEGPTEMKDGLAEDGKYTQMIREELAKYANPPSQKN